MKVVGNVADLYDQLSRIERRTKGSRLYPIHKRLSLPENKDIYDFLLANYFFDASMEILDAGCGVGYGSIKISQMTHANVTGISVSPLEIEQAIANSSGLKKSSCSFQLMSFTEVPKNAFDLIICVESLKHAIPISSSVSKLMESLKPNGRMIVVDDFYYGDEHMGRAEQQLIQDWRLENLIKVRHLPESSLRNITDYVRIKPIFLSMIKLIGLVLIRPFVLRTFLELFRGGVYLDILYRKRKMKYLICEIRKLN